MSNLDESSLPQVCKNSITTDRYVTSLPCIMQKARFVLNISSLSFEKKKKQALTRPGALPLELVHIPLLSKEAARSIKK